MHSRREILPQVMGCALLRVKRRVTHGNRHGRLDDGQDRGVSRAMAKVFSAQDRIPLLLVHGLCHLVGCVVVLWLVSSYLMIFLVLVFSRYDHETDEDWEQMTAVEDKILQQILVK